MSIRTTLFLLILALGGGAAWFVFQQNQPAQPASPTVEFLDSTLTAVNLDRIEVRRGSETRFVLEKSGKEWSLPGKWPVRTSEVEHYVQILTNLRSRFAPIPLDEANTPRRFGLEQDPLVVKLRAGDREVTLTLGDDPGDSQRFNRPTYLLMSGQQEVVRLGPGLVAALDRSAEYFQQRRLFPTEKVATDADGKDKMEQLAATSVRVHGLEGDFLINKSGDRWELKEPVADHVDPDRLKSLLVGFADLWAEKFVDGKNKKLDDFGLRAPEIKLTVTRPSGVPVTMLVGKVSREDSRVVLKQMPTGPGMPPKSFPMKVTEEYRYAKLQDNDQVFDIKAEKLKDIAVKPSSLRDPQLARFKTDAVKRLAIERGAQSVVVVKDKDRWRFEKPPEIDAEAGPVRELLEKLAELQARDSDILDKADLKLLGLEKPLAVIKVTIEDDTKDKKKGKDLDIVYHVGVKEKDKDKLYVKIDGRERVNVLDQSLLKLVERPAIAYRNRKILDLAVADLNKIEITRSGESLVFEKIKDQWSLGKADVEDTKVESLVRDLARLEAVDLVADDPKEKDLAEVYGLAKPMLRAQVSFADAKKMPKNLVIGKQREGKQEFFARLDSGPVFTIKKSLRDDIDRDALTYRRLELWKHDAADIAEVAIQKNDHKFQVRKDGASWKISGPFDASALPFEAEDLFRDVAQLNIVKYIAADAKDLTPYGLGSAKPALKLTVRGTKPEAKIHTILVGKAAEGKTRYAKLEDGSAIFTLEDKAVAGFDRTAFDLLDKTVLVLEPGSLVRLRGMGKTGFTLEKKDGGWQVVNSPAPPFLAEDEAAQALLGTLYNLRGESVAAYGPKINWADFGLDMPAYTLKLMTSKPGEKDKSAQTTEHVLSLGKEKDKGQRFVRLDKEDRIVLLSAAAGKALVRSHLDFVSTRVLKFDLDSVSGIVRQMPGADLELVKRDDNWRLSKPMDRSADDPTVGDILEKTFRLKAQRVAEYPAKNLAQFGLDKPAAVVTLKASAGDHVIKVGGPVLDEKKQDTGERFALVDKGEAVIVLHPELARHLLAPILYFADRNLASFASADRALLERGPRKLTFVKGDAAWQMIQPVKADAEDAEMESFLRGLRRLRADEIVADKGADLKLYGLDQPEARWRFLSGDREVLSLFIGKEKDGRRFARSGAGDQVFLLSQELSKKALEEYRSRKPWPATDAAQVEKLSVAGPTPLVLMKTESGAWTLSTDAAAAVNAKTVSDTLDALASLQALRFVADVKADLKLYGLDPPMWTIEVQMSSGKRTLHLGRMEGESKRVYATVPGLDAVFVVDEAAAARILRPAQGYVEGIKK